MTGKDFGSKHTFTLVLQYTDVITVPTRVNGLTEHRLCEITFTGEVGATYATIRQFGVNSW